MSSDAPPIQARENRLHRVAAAFRSAGSMLLGAALPPLCPVCREPVATVGGLCPTCWSKLSFIAPPYCERLGIPFDYDPGPGMLSLEAITNPPAYRRARAVARYDDVSRILIHSFKYGDRLDLAPALGRWMASAGKALTAEADAIVPVPLHWRRLWTRRFNQSAALAKIIAAECGLPLLHECLKRVKSTPQQVGLSRPERARNVQGAFRVPEAARNQVAGRRLVLIDDVLTSGATAEACARSLLRAGAASVDVLVFARVVNASRSPI
jgi:ComF family protein